MIHNVFSIVQIVSVSRTSVCILSLSLFACFVFALYSLVIVKEKLDWITYKEKDKTNHWEIFKSVLKTFFMLYNIILMMPG